DARQRLAREGRRGGVEELQRFLPGRMARETAILTNAATYRDRVSERRVAAADIAQPVRSGARRGRASRAPQSGARGGGECPAAPRDGRARSSTASPPSPTSRDRGAGGRRQTSSS